MVNFSVAVREEHERIVFLRSLVPGGADRSYGVEVARLAGLPFEVIERARRLLTELESSHEGDGRPLPRRPDPAQLTLFSAPPHPAVERLRRVDPNHLTPIQALALLADVVAMAREETPTGGSV